MSFSLLGVGVSRGIAIGRVHILERDQLEISEYTIERNAISEEVHRFQSALTQARLQLRAVREHVPKKTSTDIAAFIDTHLLMLEDSALAHEPTRLIRELKCNAEWALKLQRDALVAVFDEMEDAYLRTRRDDVDHVVSRIQRILLNHQPLRHEMPDSRLRGYIVVADDLSPADTVLIQHHGIVAFATESGGQTSHTAILARSLGIPCIVGLHHMRRYIREDDEIIIDGKNGLLLVDPDERALEHYREAQKREEDYNLELYKLKEKPSTTKDNAAISLLANIELPGDFDTFHKVGAKGVGLYRTEFLFMNRDTIPDEEEHYNSYLEMLKALGDVSVTIRTFDLGADKTVDGGRVGGPSSLNPALGLRAIRLCLKEPNMFIPQLRAIIRASAKASIRLLVPMLSNIEEVDQVLQVIRDVQNALKQEGIAFDEEMPIGGMIEVPAAAICADMFAEKLDFLSIGTNDLIQYSMAIDRVNEEVNYLYDPLNPGVLRLIQHIIRAGEEANIPVIMCGEMASDTRYVRLLLALGLRNFSIHPAALLEVKRLISESDLSQLQKQMKDSLKLDCRPNVSKLVEQMNQ